MKATINVKKGSAYAKENGKTFEVQPIEFFTCRGKIIVPIQGVNPEFPKSYVDFSQDELIFSN